MDYLTVKFINQTTILIDGEKYTTRFDDRFSKSQVIVGFSTSYMAVQLYHRSRHNFQYVNLTNDRKEIRTFSFEYKQSNHSAQVSTLSIEVPLSFINLFEVNYNSTITAFFMSEVAGINIEIINKNFVFVLETGPENATRACDIDVESTDFSINSLPKVIRNGNWYFYRDAKLFRKYKAV